MAPRTAGFGVGEREAGLGHPSHVRLVLVGVQPGHVAEREEGFSFQVVGPQRVVVEDGQQQAGPLLTAFLGGDQAEGGVAGHVGPSHPTPLGPKIPI